MAASAVYFSAVQVPIARPGGDAHNESNLSVTGGTFYLLGGRYALSVVATFGGGSVTLETLGPDGSTFLTAATAFSANGTSIADLPPGTYKVVLA